MRAPISQPDSRHAPRARGADSSWRPSPRSPSSRRPARSMSASFCAMHSPCRTRRRPTIPRRASIRRSISRSESQAAESVLRAMSLTQNFARLVIFAGHGASVVNNPHASALHCGACGGYSGEVNARLLAALLNDRDVRQKLNARGIEIPEDTALSRRAPRHDDRRRDALHPGCQRRVAPRRSCRGRTRGSMPLGG